MSNTSILESTPSLPVSSIENYAKTKNQIEEHENLYFTTLKEEPLQLLSQYKWWIICLVWTVARVISFVFLSPQQDTLEYFHFAKSLFNGGIPYKDFALEYPPLMLFFIIWPKIFTNQQVEYCLYFGMLAAAFDFMLVMSMYALGKKVIQPYFKDKNTLEGCLTLAVLSYIITSTFTSELILARLDVFLAFILAQWMLALLEDPEHWTTHAWLALGIGFKLFPIFLVPLHFAYIYSHKRDSASGLWNFKAIFKQLWRPLGIFLVIVLCMILPFFIAAKHHFWSFLSYHQKRGIQFESLYSSLLLLWDHMSTQTLKFNFDFGCTQLSGYTASVLAKISPWVQLLCTLGCYALTLPSLLRKDTRDKNSIVLFVTTSIVLLNIATAKVFSPQYIFWFYPFIFLIAFHPKTAGLRIYSQSFTLALLTGCIYLFYYGDIIQKNSIAIYILLLRNIIVLLFGILFTMLASEHAHLKRYFMVRFCISPIVKKWLIAFPLVILFVWIGLANLSETTANDIWIQIRSGRDIVTSGSFPDKEVYSSTVLGRHFIAHEWMSSVIFYYLTHWFGGAGLSFLASVVALGCSIFLYYSQERTVRHSGFYIPLLAFVSYLISFRMLMRPHVFTMLAQTIMIMSIERWRRDGKMKWLWLLVPIQLIWINLHAAAIFGPMLMMMCIGVIGFCKIFANWGTFGETRNLSWVDIQNLSIITLCMCLVCVLNPYGTEIVTFSIDLFNNDYVKNRVWEWTTPFMMSNLGYYWLWLYMFGLCLAWSCIVLRIRTLPLLDIAFTVLATYMSVRANRFVPDLVILTFPSMVRSLFYIEKQWLPSVWQGRRLILENGVVGLLLTHALTFGYAHSPREHRPEVGWGFGGDMPYQEAALIQRLGLKGRIFNEYSDGSVMIHDLVPDVRPVLDSRIDLYPIEAVHEYDQAYTNPEYFFRYIQRHDINLICLYRNRAHPGIIYTLAHDPQWQLLSDVNNRVLYRRK